MNQARLCLRIPSSSDIATPVKRKEKLKLDHSQSLSKPTSPKPKELSFQNLSRGKKRPIDRITDMNAIKFGTLPKFLTTSIELSKSLSPKAKPKKSNYLVTTSIDCPTDSSSIPSNELQARCKTPFLFDQAEFISSVKATLSPDEVLVTIRNKQLTRKELQSLVTNAVTECNLIDTCLILFKHLNRSKFRKNEHFDRVKLVETQYSKQIFCEPSYEFLFKKNPLKYEFILFPVFVKTWMLFVLDTRNLKLKICAIKISEKIVDIAVQKVREFVANELSKHERKLFEMTNWVHMSCEIIEMQGIQEIDSGIGLLKAAYKIAVDPYSNLETRPVAEFKSQIMMMIFKNGKHISYAT